MLAALYLLHGPHRSWGITSAHAQDAAAEIEAANKRVVQLFGQGQRQQALALAAETLKRALSALGEKHPRTLTSLNNYAEVLRALGRAAEALPHSERALKLRTEVLGENPNATAT